MRVSNNRKLVVFYLALRNPVKGNEAADSLCEGVFEVIKGGANGFDKSLMKVTIELDKDLKDKGIEIGRAARLDQKNDQGQDGVYYLYQSV